MITSAKCIAAALALAVIGPPSFAKNRVRHISADLEFPQISAARGAALRECNAKVENIRFSSRQTEQFAVYRVCMFDHGEME